MRRRKILSNPNVLPFQEGPVDKNPFMWRGSEKAIRGSRDLLKGDQMRQRMRPESAFSHMLPGMDMAAEKDYLNAIMNGHTISEPFDAFKRGVELGKRRKIKP